MAGMNWMLFGIGFIPVVLGILTMAGLWLPALRCYPKNSHKRPNEPLSRGETIGAGSFLIGFGALLIWLSVFR
jgi:hypothetical protein